MVIKGILATFRVESDLWEQFKSRASENRYSASALLVQFVEDYVQGKASNAIDGYTRIDNIDSRIDELHERLYNLEKRLDVASGSIDMGVAIAECIDVGEASDTPIGTQQLCAHLGVNYKNLSSRGRKHGRTPEKQLIAEALEKGQHWQVCDRNGRMLLWKQII
jgi:hypothetical protein